MDARWKLVAAFLAFFSLPWLTSLPAALIAFLLSLLLLINAEIPYSWWRDRLLGVGIFLSLFVIVLPLTIGPTSWSFGILSISKRGTLLAMLILFKSLTAVSWTLFLIGTTSMETMLHAATTLRVPLPLLRVGIITWRFVFIMYETIEQFRIALRLRGFRNRAQWQTYRTIASIVGTLLVQGVEHTERVSQAMRCRGYRGRVVTLQEFHTRMFDVFLFSLAVGCQGCLLWCSVYWR